jgi:ABC-type polysaccharide/polyol phosphate transport system ATPase subunit
MSDGSGNGSPAAIVAESLSKCYRLGELQSLQQTVNHLVRRKARRGSTIDAVSGLDFTVRRGDAFGIVGTNGSGKSTVLQILAGTIVPTGGCMTVHGRVLPLLAVGTGFHPELTARENVTLFATTLGVPRGAIADRIDAVGVFGEFEQHMDTPVKRFSSGMLCRLSFAIAMQFPADIYVFDEVLAVVDGEFQARCLGEISRLHAAGRTVIFVSHDLDQVAEVCETVMWLERGRLELLGTAPDVLSAYTRVHASVIE